MIVKLEILLDVSDDFIEYHKDTGDTRNVPQIILDKIAEDFEEHGNIKVILAEGSINNA